MNLILVRPGERVAPDVVRLEGRRADHVARVLRVAVGDRLRIGVPDGPRGHAAVTAVGKGRVDLVIEDLDAAPPPVPRVDLLLAMPRPKALSRIVEHVCALGVGTIAITRSWRVEKSYLKSERLERPRLDAHVWAGLEQAGDTRVPEIRVFPRFRPFVEDEVDGLFPRGRRLVAHPAAAVPLGGDVLDGAERVVVAIGPEGGFIPFEVELLRSRAFVPVSLGGRVLRVETACTAAFARLGLLLGS